MPPGWSPRGGFFFRGRGHTQPPFWTWGSFSKGFVWRCAAFGLLSPQRKRKIVLKDKSQPLFYPGFFPHPAGFLSGEFQNALVPSEKQKSEGPFSRIGSPSKSFGGSPFLAGGCCLCSTVCKFYKTQNCFGGGGFLVLALAPRGGLPHHRQHFGFFRPTPLLVFRFRGGHVFLTPFFPCFRGLPTPSGPFFNKLFVFPRFPRVP